jgi:hypothetical protein
MHMCMNGTKYMYIVTTILHMLTFIIYLLLRYTYKVVFTQNSECRPMCIAKLYNVYIRMT